MDASGHPIVCMPQGFNLASDMPERLNFQDKYDLLIRSDEYLSLQNMLGQDVVPRKDLKRIRIRFGKGNFDEKTHAFLSKCDLPQESMLWISRLQFHFQASALSSSSSSSPQQSSSSSSGSSSSGAAPLTCSPSESSQQPLQQPFSCSSSSSPQQSAPALSSSGAAPLTCSSPPAFDLPAIPLDSLDAHVSLEQADVKSSSSSGAAPPLTCSPSESSPPAFDLPAIPLDSLGDACSNDADARPFPGLPCNTELLSLLSGPLSSSNLHKFNANMEEMHNEQARDFLKPQTLAKSFTMVSLAVKNMCGGPHLSKVHAFERFCASESIKSLQDITAAWNRRAYVGVNKSEAYQLKKSVYQLGPSDQLQALYYLQICEKFGFKAILQRGNVAVRDNLRRLTAFTYFSMILARPATRAGVFLTTTLPQIDVRKQENGHLILLFEQHKTARSYGVLACSMAPWFVEILQDYLTFVRPYLVSSRKYFTNENDLVFPKRTNEYLESYLTSILGPHHLSASHVRTFFCEHVAALSKQSPFFPFQDQLQYCAAHESKSLSLSVSL